MRINELMHNDWVYNGSHFVRYDVTKMNPKAIVENRETCLIPIRLSRSILELNGFVFKNDNYCYLKTKNYIISFYYLQKFSVSYFGDRFREILTIDKDEWNVHELQQSLRLAGFWDKANKIMVI